MPLVAQPDTGEQAVGESTKMWSAPARWERHRERIGGGGSCRRAEIEGEMRQTLLEYLQARLRAQELQEDHQARSNKSNTTRDLHSTVREKDWRACSVRPRPRPAGRERKSMRRSALDVRRRDADLGIRPKQGGTSHPGKVGKNKVSAQFKQAEFGHHVWQGQLARGLADRRGRRAEHIRKSALVH